jgi:membrane protein
MKPKHVFHLLKTTVTEWQAHKASRLAAALAYYTLLSIAPLIVLVVAITGLVFGDDAARGDVAAQLRGVMGPEAGQAIEAIVANANAPREGLVGTLIGIGVLLFGASWVFAELQDSMNTIWEVTPKPGRGLKGIVKDRFFSFTMVLGVAFLLLVSLVLSTVLSAIGDRLASALPGGEAVWHVVNFAVSFGVITLLFALMYKVIPDVKIQWSDVWVGAVVTALLFTLGKYGIGIYLGNASVASPYGAAGSVVVLVVWVYYSAQILFFGAEFTQVYTKMYGTRVVPDDDAVALTNAEKLHQGIVRDEDRDEAAKRPSRPLGPPAPRAS